MTLTRFVIPGLPEGEPGIQIFASTVESWIPGSIADEAGDGPGMTEVESASNANMAGEAERFARSARDSKKKPARPPRFARGSGSARRAACRDNLGDIEFPDWAVPQPVGADMTLTRFVIPGLPEGEPGIQLFASTVESWIPGSIADEAGDGPGMTEVESASNANMAGKRADQVGS